MAQHEQIHCAQFPGSLVGQIFTDQIEVTIRHHALESGCFVVNATSWLSPEQVGQITSDEKLQRVLSGGCNTAIIDLKEITSAHPLQKVREWRSQI
jgi:aliphatic nitrilase